MATKGKKQDKKSGGDRAPQREHPGIGTPAPAPRLRAYYEGTVRQRLQQQFGLDNVHQIPKLTKIVINVGVGEAVKQPKFLDGVV